MFKEYMLVTATEKISELVNTGCFGTIVYKYNSDIFEVEFFDDTINTISIETVSKNQIQEMNFFRGLLRYRLLRFFSVYNNYVIDILHIQF